MMQDWFSKAKLGIFIHYGIYAVKGVSESWSFHNGHISYDDYMAQKQGFTASNYDPEAWAELFADAGARYAVLTTKHHDGVALWDTDTSTHNVVDETPAGRDLILPYTEAMRSRGLKVGLYYSLIDWSREDYRSVYQAGTPEAERANQNIYSTPAGGEENPELWEDFLRFNDAQMEELMTRFGTIDLLWFDGDWERSAEQWKMAKFRDYLHALNPNVILNSRMMGYGDYLTPEQGIPVLPPEGPWEFCTTVNSSWGFQHDDQQWKTSRQVIRMFCDCLTLGGNMLLDVGPMEDGTIPEQSVQVLRDLGAWIRTHEEAVYDPDRGLDYWFYLGGSTISADKKTVYLFVYDLPVEDICLKGIQTQIKNITVLHSGKSLDWQIHGGAPWNNIPGTCWIDLTAEDCYEDGPTVLKVELQDELKLYYGHGQAISFNE